MASEKRNGHRRVAIVRGLRTPFVKAGTVFAGLTALDLGRMVVQELVQRSDLDPNVIDQLVFGTVIPSLTAPSIAREVVIAAGLPMKIEAATVTKACATSIQAMTTAANSIAVGEVDVAIAGGTEAMSDAPVFTSRPLAHALAAASKGRSLPEKLRPFQKLKATDLVPVPPAIAEYSTGLSMGESAEKMAKENGISRDEQDRIAWASHRNAAAAWKDGRFDNEVMHVSVPPQYEQTVTRDNIIREDSTLEALGKLKPVFDRKYGTVTAGNASPLTDGAAALLLMSEERARALGYEPLGYLRSHAYAATDPGDQLLQGPVYAVPTALKRAGMKLSDIDLVEMHEAFAAQVGSNLQALASKAFAKKAGWSEPVGEIDRERLNVTGGSIAIGHPFGATGARIVTQALNELKRRNKNTVMCTVCAAGGLGAVVVLERA
ncbi:acetyl-CoA C-acyltransferase FadI [Myxococcus sp. CA051A]|uniref:Acetyl-CoA C-acyltransferase FadI n=1 Tax=Myxococcus llanfairpwllgwyngyllgogerychwyrndrobwllllantysiliogogogochensis TaxID=2590453 RepID=A0A540X7L8_9BACT|nr:MULTISPECIES: acetyl-CoA C-acyltransferase FadI [Myxococcus]NTX00954.1 acetyl-CoA C-acyltransferase FadI [Myxococcus sp. CA040A]NTX52527.1 acetyl-CoA C-acyltransferase FadI [Myxococcus sp. CA039A]NTX59579.1 acetyl-CoA C-acyltransferase FadI [Myxococcus sp. CA051A]TQF17301.1 acetyl-CoA C-acyltransferase FadI [Myxococcus llanfairpwllgwyngyllgogerychwyrndrobwllllantysiliogogogochensis]